MSVERDGRTFVVALREHPKPGTPRAAGAPPLRYVTIAIALSLIPEAFGALMRARYGRNVAVADLELELSGDLSP